ncbi:hypothetical protein NEUTE1DRAFT_64300 [Neurospora tetrasperma FGSC 2508]|uniref:Cytochrome b5 heme-binding domain-containing protein n=1 Tax=Neurospora tetrasperma (strain FGSC 2508 / ATCC MYA-4615 / P0657) TaxID=510951 RepID=F8MR84_NEUT8|nr:uncharacterized protein NEUTE1DRAFT_64300 [Neurospora tetrasperma FGSC 2508]EGO56043.1 hypothetical protein NEUTE1DRAFT_64300 [Neurospora tetrasperma FGSC 2508]EGZ71108.1 cytochrome b5 [Neurospora tetrasperma FGSC 2509]
MADTDTVRRRKPESKTPATNEPGHDTASATEDSDVEEIIRPGFPPHSESRNGGKKKKAPKRRIEDEDESNPWLLDILRVISFLFLASCGLSYLISNGESFFWGMSHPPNYLQLEWWKSQLRGPIYLTPAELAAFDGTDESKPIYLAINGTIYDVSANRRTYGPGGSYHVFAGVDASRAYVTGCFAEDRTPDMRGVEEMFLPLDDPAVDNKYWTPEELKQLKRKEMEEALKKVNDALKHWANFFGKSKKYRFVGYVKRDKDWLKKEPVPKLCEAAGRGRTPRSPPEEEKKKH